MVDVSQTKTERSLDCINNSSVQTKDSKEPLLSGKEDNSSDEKSYEKNGPIVVNIGNEKSCKRIAKFQRICCDLNPRDLLVIVSVGVCGSTILCLGWVFLSILSSPILIKSPLAKLPLKNVDYPDEDETNFDPNEKKMLGLKSAMDKVFIRKHWQLQGITELTETVTVLSLISQSPPAGISKSGAGSVRTLEISGKITQPWLHYLLSSFKFLTTLIINVDNICTSLGPSKLYKTSSIVLPNLENIFATNSLKCPIMSWGFSLETPKLRTIAISKANLTKAFYKVFYDLLNKTSNTLQMIEISESTICSNCDITELQFDNLLGLKITKTVNDEDWESMDYSEEMSDEDEALNYDNL